MKTNIKKQVLFFSAVLFSISLGIIIPLHFSHAFIAESIGMYVGSWIIAGGLQVVLAVSSLIVGLAGMILSWVLSPYFMSMPYTSGGVVEIGWPIVRDFINMFFVLGLVVIGLATALRLKEYQAQKALPVLIIIAILINFTPVICGVIVDASNILMNFFLEEISGFGTMINLFSSQGAMLAQTITADSFSQLAALPFTIIGKTLIMIVFAWVTAFIFFMYSMLFIMRYVMIWVLVIVSPIAFFSRIFPATKKGEYVFKSILGWDEWWKQFFEWTLIGVTGAFFLYLGEQIMNGFSISTAGWLQGIPPEGGGWVIDIITAPIIEFMNTMLSWGVVLAFLFIGWMVAIETKALGAKHITDTFKKMGKKMGVAGLKVGAGATIKAGGLIKDTALGSGAGFYGGIKTEKGLGKIKGAVMGAHMGGISGIKQGAARWYKDKDLPNNATRMDKIKAGFQTAFEDVKSIPKAGAKAAAKDLGVPELFEEPKKPGEKPEMPEMPDLPSNLSDEERTERIEDFREKVNTYGKETEEYSTQKKPSAAPVSPVEPEKPSTSPVTPPEKKKTVQATFGQPSEPQEKAEKWGGIVPPTTPSKETTPPPKEKQTTGEFYKELKEERREKKEKRKERKEKKEKGKEKEAGWGAGREKPSGVFKKARIRRKIEKSTEKIIKENKKREEKEQKEKEEKKAGWK
ncbi:hypothetical protein KAU40_01455 [Candidatus Parcubacteria bacterium]|nr:hypothetical protein [Candidatus Parcubacteria bacterium]